MSKSEIPARVPVRTEIPRILRDEIARTKLTYERAHEEWKAIESDIPSGIPGPDGTQRIRNAANNYQAAMEDYHRAVGEFNAFIKGGTIPERLKKA